MGDLRRLRGTHRRRNQAPSAASRNAPPPESSTSGGYKRAGSGELKPEGSPPRRFDACRAFEPVTGSHAYIIGASVPSLHLLNQGPHCSRCPEIAQTKSTWTGTFQENGLWRGRSPGKTQDLPGKWPLAWKVPRKNAGPSRKMAPGMEGPPEKRRTFRENGLWHGRSWGRCRASPEKGWFFGTELLIGRGNPWKVPFSWMGLESSAGGAA